MEMKATAMIQL